MCPLTLWASASTAESSPTGGMGAAAVALSLLYGLVVGFSLLRVGFDDVQGYLEGGLADWETHGFGLGRLDTASVHDLAARLKDRGSRPFVLDVRTDSEWDGGHIEGAHHIHGGTLEDRYGEVPRDRPVAVVCGSGYRASIASSFLKREGYADVTNVLGGMAAWKAAGLPTAKD